LETVAQLLLTGNGSGEGTESAGKPRIAIVSFRKVAQELDADQRGIVHSAIARSPENGRQFAPHHHDGGCG
jgi:hypothetical protein